MPENNGVNNEEKPNINVNKAQDEKKDGYFAKKNSNANDVGAKIPNNKNKNQNLNGRAYKNPPPAKKAVEGSFNKNEETPAFNSLEGKINKPRGIKRGRMSSSGSDGSVNSSDRDDIEKKNKKKNDSNSDSKNQNNDKNKKKGGILPKRPRLRDKIKGFFNTEDDDYGDEIGENLMRFNPFLIIGKIITFKVIAIAIIIVAVIFIIYGLLVIIFSSSKDGQEPSVYGPGESSCVRTMNADTSNQSEARFTHYFTVEYKSDGTRVEQYSLGAVGDINDHVKVGNAYFNSDGYAIWKGGSEYNGVKYGIDGIDYYIVATANKKVIGACAGTNCQQKYQENSDIKYFEYGDTFSLGVTKQNGEEEVINAIVLDSCGACMDWALSSTGVYRPHSEAEIQKCQRSSGYKIDFYAHLQSDTKGFKDMGYIMGGVTSNTCVGQVDLGELVTGTDDTKQLQNLSLNTLLGADGIAEVNRQIENNVNRYGSGTGNGVAAAAITLLNSLKQKGYRLPYRWGGGHGTIDVGINGNWGTNIGPSPSPHTNFYYDSLDCSGFVSWAIRNGGCTNYTVGQGTGVLYNYGALEGKNDAKPGDILIRRSEDSGHVLLVVQNNAGSIILAESGVRGIVFSDYNEANHGNYNFRDMTSFYESTSCK